MSVQATEREEPDDLLENPLVGLQETGQQVEAEASSPAQVTIPTDNALAVEESHIAHTVDEPVVETDTEVVLVGADPRLVPEEPLHTFIDQSRFNVSELIGRRISGDAFALKQGKGFVLGGPLLDVFEEQVAMQDVATPAGGSSSIARVVGDYSSHGDSLQRGREAVSATLGAPLPEVPVIPTLESPVEFTSSPLMQTQVRPCFALHKLFCQLGASFALVVVF